MRGEKPSSQFMSASLSELRGTPRMCIRRLLFTWPGSIAILGVTTLGAVAAALVPASVCISAEVCLGPASWLTLWLTFLALFLMGHPGCNAPPDLVLLAVIYVHEPSHPKPCIGSPRAISISCAVELPSWGPCMHIPPSICPPRLSTTSSAPCRSPCTIHLVLPDGTGDDNAASHPDH